MMINDFQDDVSELAAGQAWLNRQKKKPKRR